MGKKKIRKTKTSKGLRSSISKMACKLVEPSFIDKAMHKVNAWRDGKNPWITVQNRETGTNRPFYKVKANDLWGNPKFLSSGLFKGEQ
jgi:hypothetical protein